MEYRLGTIDDLSSIMNIIEEARLRLKKSGSLQWNTPEGYPNSLDISEDIMNNNLYVAIDNDIIVGTMTLIEGIDANYTEIDGKWLNNNSDYLTIHRIAVSDSVLGKGVGHFLIQSAKKEASIKKLTSIKADTHRININMRSLLLSEDFKYCGEIILKETSIDNKRDAFEYIL